MAQRKIEPHFVAELKSQSASRGALAIEALVTLLISSIVLTSALGSLHTVYRSHAKLRVENEIELRRRTLFLHFGNALQKANSAGAFRLYIVHPSSGGVDHRGRELRLPGLSPENREVLSVLIPKPGAFYQRLIDPAHPHWYCRVLGLGLQLPEPAARSFLAVGTDGAGEVRASMRRLRSSHPDCEPGQLYRGHVSRIEDALLHPPMSATGALIPLAERVSFYLTSDNTLRRVAHDSNTVQPLEEHIHNIRYSLEDDVLRVFAVVSSSSGRTARQVQFALPVRGAANADPLDYFG